MENRPTYYSISEKPIVPKIDTNHSAVQPKSRVSSQKLKALRVLVIEDDPQFRVLLRTVLAGIGVKSVGAVDGMPAALRELKNTATDLVIVDWRLKGNVNGIDCIQKIRAMQQTEENKIPILMVTGYRESRLHEEARQAGANGILTKPISSRSLLDKLSCVIANQATELPNSPMTQ